MTKVDIFSGFLGAGKTTLIKKLIEDGAYGDEKIVLIENEFGEIGVDSRFLKDTGIEINQMDSGCICCSLVGDFGKALNKVIEEFSPDRILIEPSGVGKLSDVIIAVQDLHNDKIQLNGFTTVVDAKKCKMYMKNFGEFFNNQVEHASSIVLSHVGNLSQEQLDGCVELLRKHNGEASIITTDWNSITGTQILETMEKKQTLSAELDHLRKNIEEETHHHHHDHHNHEHGGHHHHDHHHADDVFDELGTYTNHKFTVDFMENALKELMDEDKVGVVLRAKGIVECEDGEWIHFDYVPGEPDIRLGTSATTGMICVIGAGLNKDEIKNIFGL